MHFKRIYKKKEFKIFILFWLLFIYFSYLDGWNENSRLNLTRAIVNDGIFRIDEYKNNTGDLIIYEGHYYTSKDPGSSFMAIPAYTIYSLLFGKLTPDKNDSYEYLWFVFLMIAFVSAPAGALTVVLVYKISKYFTDNMLHRNLTTIICGAGTILFSQSRVYMGHTLATFFSFLCFYLIFVMIKEKKDYSLVAGFVGGSAVLISRLMFIFVFFIFLYIILKKINKNCIFKFVLGFLLTVSVLFLYNYANFDNILLAHVTKTQIVRTLGSDPLVQEHMAPISRHCISENLYHSDCLKANSVLFLENLSVCEEINNTDYKNYCLALAMREQGPCQEIIDAKLRKTCLKVYTGLTWFSFPSFQQISLNLIVRLLFYPYRGLFFYSPILILSLIGLIFLYKNHKLELILISSIFLSTLCALSTLTISWGGGSSFGPRFLTETTPFLMIPLILIMKKVNTKFVLFLTITSIFINIIGLQHFKNSLFSSDPYFHIKDSYFEIFNSMKPLANPLFDYYFPEFLAHGPRSLLLEELFNVSIPAYINISVILTILIFMANFLNSRG